MVIPVIYVYILANIFASFSQKKLFSITVNTFVVSRTGIIDLNHYTDASHNCPFKQYLISKKTKQSTINYSNKLYIRTIDESNPSRYFPSMLYAAALFG